MRPTAPSTHRIVTVDGREVALDVRIIPDGDRERIAASIAWFALSPAEANAVMWEQFVADIVAPHVSFTIDEALMPQADKPWWTHLVRAAASELIEVNGLDSLIRRHAEASTPTI